ncbi:MAG: hypothetical protein FJ088_00905 [Deltaproteobacteria bacterium]|nr:hypothetical protein [Deltaproteobacteria bacterium]
MNKFVIFLILAASFARVSHARANAWAVGDVFIITDMDGTILNPEMGLDPATMGIDLYKVGQAFYKQYPDEFDFLTVFTTTNVGIQSGIPVSNSVKGIGQGSFYGETYSYAAKYGSKGKLKEVVKMGNVSLYPTYDKLEVGTVGLIPITPIELLAHETGHIWLVWISYDLGDGVKHEDLRGVNEKGHWNYLYNSGQSDSYSSVMYGNVWKYNPDKPGCFTTQKPAPSRKYSPLDQYLMGLRAPEEVPDSFLIVNDNLPAETSDSMPSNGNYEICGDKLVIGISDIILAMGPREPAWNEAQHEFRNAFILVIKNGESSGVLQTAIQKVDGFRKKWEEWFPYATDNRGKVTTNLKSGDPQPEQAEPAPEQVETAPDVAEVINPEDIQPESADIPVDQGIDAPSEEAGFEELAVSEEGGGDVKELPLEIQHQDTVIIDKKVEEEEISSGGGCSQGNSAPNSSVILMILFSCSLLVLWNKKYFI